jgi:arginyl-tRNA synthetase
MSANPLLLLETALRQAVTAAGWSWPETVNLGVPNQATHGEVTTDLAFRLTAQSHCSPIETAEKIQQHLTLPDVVAEVSVAAGHLNFKLSPTGWQALLTYWRSPEVWQRSDLTGQTVVAEYSSPNIGKPFSVGHLRTTILGDVSARLYERVGAEVIRVNHLGDWGTQFGKLIVAVQKWSSESALPTLGVDGLLQLYVKFHAAAEADSSLEEAARQWSKKIEDGDAEATRLWRQIVDVSLIEYRRLYDRLGISFDYLAERGESFYTLPMMMAVLDELRAAGLVKESDGAQVLMFPNDELPSTVLIRQDGGTVYLLRDLAALKYRLTDWQADRVVYFVGSEQSLHFQQLFKAAVLVGWIKADEADRLQHAANGLYRLPEGKMSSRKGRGIMLNDLLTEGEAVARQLVKEKSSDLPPAQQDSLVAALSLAAIKYNDLAHHRQSNFTFTWDKALSMEGNSAPYLLYTLARAHGVFRKAGLKVSAAAGDVETELLSSEREQWLLLTPWRWQATLGAAARESSPNLICELLFDTARAFNAFYNDTPILVDDQSARQARLALCERVIATLTEGLTLLGLPIVTEL